MIQLKGVKKDFVIGDVRQSAIKDVSCEIKQGEFIVLSGRSGSGKSTLLNLLAGLDVPDQGQILFEGNDFAKLSDRQVSEIRLNKIGFIFQTFNLIPVLSAFENVQYPLLYLKMSAAERNERTHEILKQVGLQKFHNSLPSQLSGGQRQRVAIARALVKSPSVVLADEPTANLDVHTSQDIVALIESIFLDKKCSVVFCTHDAKMVTRGTRWLEMSDGLLVQDRSMK